MTLNDTLKIYVDKRILWVFLLGCASGFLLGPYCISTCGMAQRCRRLEN